MNNDKKSPLGDFKVPEHVKRAIDEKQIPEEVKILQKLQEQNKEKVFDMMQDVLRAFATMGYKLIPVIARRASDNAMIPQFSILPLSIEEHQEFLKSKKKGDKI